ncbi:hypothetical protein ACSHWG_12080 [Leucobacter sp. Z1108]|uniref:hypothetical protein n=1 Tax=Leucobacter sp. Z1108 TaxID=3439066 RepID=UPI003F2BA283
MTPHSLTQSEILNSSSVPVNARASRLASFEALNVSPTSELNGSSPASWALTSEVARLDRLVDGNAPMHRIGNLLGEQEFFHTNKIVDKRIPLTKGENLAGLPLRPSANGHPVKQGLYLWKRERVAFQRCGIPDEVWQ